MNTNYVNKLSMSHSISALVVLALMALALVASEARSDELVAEIVTEAQALQPERIRLADARKANEASVNHAAEGLKASTREDLDIRFSGHTSFRVVGEFTAAARDRG